VGLDIGEIGRHATLDAVIRRAVLVCCMLLLTSCKVGVEVAVDVRADGSGAITLLATVDDATLEAAPSLADDLRLDDAQQAGWTVDGPREADGGLQVAMTHEFATVEEATALLASLNGPGGPLRGVVITRDETGGKITTTVSGALRVDGGLNAFADPEVLDLLGGKTPYADTIANAGLTPADVLTIDVEIDVGDGPVAHTAPLDGSMVDLANSSVRAAQRGSGVWGVVATVLLVLLLAWLTAAISFIIFVAVKRRALAR
jgi:hypothetical protein